MFTLLQTTQPKTPSPDTPPDCIAPHRSQALVAKGRERRAADRAGRGRAERELAAARLELAAAQAAAAAAAGGGAHMQQVSGTAAVFPLVPIGTLRSCFDSRCVDDARWMIHHPTSPPPLLRPSITHSHAPSINHLSTPLEQHTHTHTRANTHCTRSTGTPSYTPTNLPTKRKRPIAVEGVGRKQHIQPKN